MKPEQAKNIRNFIIGFIVFGMVGYLFLMVWMRGDLGEFYPDSATSTTMYVLKRKILHYAKANNKLPNSIEELPELEGFLNRNTDGWGVPIRMEINGNEVTLHSFGKDNKPGGTGKNLDFIHVFEAIKPSGEWADENDQGYPSWKKLSKIRWDKSEYE
jgi:hypothetical protein